MCRREEALRQWLRRRQQQAGRGKVRFTSPASNSEIKPMRKMDESQGVDDLATLYIPNLAVKKIVAALRDGPPPPLQDGDGVSEAQRVRALEGCEAAKGKEAQAIVNKALLRKARSILDYLVDHVAAHQPPPSGPREMRMLVEASPLLLCEKTLIEHEGEEVPLRNLMDLKFFTMSLGDLMAWQDLLSAVAPKDMEALLGGEINFYGVKRRCEALKKKQEPPSHEERRTRQEKRNVGRVQEAAARSNKRKRAELQSLKAELVIKEEEALLHEAMLHEMMEKS